MASDDLVTVRRYLHPPEAHLACGVLEAEGIQAVIQDEETSQLYTTVLTGGVRLQVTEKDLDRARQLLDAFDEAPAPPEAE